MLLLGAFILGLLTHRLNLLNSEEYLLPRELMMPQENSPTMSLAGQLDTPSLEGSILEILRKDEVNELIDSLVTTG